MEIRLLLLGNMGMNNCDVYEHQFEIDENITVDEFQKLLDNAKETIMSTLNNIEDEEK